MVTKLPAANARIARKLANELAKNKKKAEKAWNRTLNVNKMKGATAQQIQRKRMKLKKSLKKINKYLINLLKEFEEKTGKTISTTDKAGNKKIDYNLARESRKRNCRRFSTIKRNYII